MRVNLDKDYGFIDFVLTLILIPVVLVGVMVFTLLEILICKVDKKIRK